MSKKKKKSGWNTNSRKKKRKGKRKYSPSVPVTQSLLLCSEKLSKLGEHLSIQEITRIKDGKTLYMMTRGEAIKLVWKYVRAKGLKDPNPVQKAGFICDNNLFGIFRVSKVGFYDVAGLLSAHLQATGEVVERGGPAPARVVVPPPPTNPAATSQRTVPRSVLHPALLPANRGTTTLAGPTRHVQSSRMQKAVADSRIHRRPLTVADCLPSGGKGTHTSVEMRLTTAPESKRAVIRASSGNASSNAPKRDGDDMLRASSALFRLIQLTGSLSGIKVEIPVITEMDALRVIAKYCKIKKLRDKKDKKFINCDAELKKLFKVDSFRIDHCKELLKGHLRPQTEKPKKPPSPITRKISRAEQLLSEMKATSKIREAPPEFCAMRRVSVVSDKGGQQTKVQRKVQMGASCSDNNSTSSECKRPSTNFEDAKSKTKPAAKIGEAQQPEISQGKDWEVLPKKAFSIAAKDRKRPSGSSRHSFDQNAPVHKGQYNKKRRRTISESSDEDYKVSIASNRRQQPAIFENRSEENFTDVSERPRRRKTSSAHSTTFAFSDEDEEDVMKIARSRRRHRRRIPSSESSEEEFTEEQQHPEPIYISDQELEINDRAGIEEKCTLAVFLSRSNLDGASSKSFAEWIKQNRPFLKTGRHDSAAWEGSLTEWVCQLSTEPKPEESKDAILGEVKENTSQCNGMDNENVCCVCLENPRNSCIVHGNSGHPVCCFECAQLLKKKKQGCPICRQRITKVIKLFNC